MPGALHPAGDPAVDRCVYSGGIIKARQNHFFIFFFYAFTLCINGRDVQ